MGSSTNKPEAHVRHLSLYGRPVSDKWSMEVHEGVQKQAVGWTQGKYHTLRNLDDYSLC